MIASQLLVPFFNHRAELEFCPGTFESVGQLYLIFLLVANRLFNTGELEHEIVVLGAAGTGLLFLHDRMWCRILLLYSLLQLFNIALQPNDIRISLSVL